MDKIQIIQLYKCYNKCEQMLKNRMNVKRCKQIEQKWTGVTNRTNVNKYDKSLFNVSNQRITWHIKKSGKWFAVFEVSEFWIGNAEQPN